MIAAFLTPFLDLLYPPRCILCHTLGGSGCLCPACCARVEPRPDGFCPRCARTLEPNVPCSHCRRRTPAFARCRAFGHYEGVLRELIFTFKYHDRPQLAEPLGRLLAAHARAEAAALNSLAFDAVVPVPMHPIRKRLRGYNQSERLARVLCRELALPLDADALRRIRATRPQVGLAGAARENNLRAAFAVPRPDAVQGKTFLLIDDVTTTGSTLHECARSLKAAGAKAVYGLTLAAG